MNPAQPLNAVRGDRFSVVGVSALAPLRAGGGVQVILGDRVWITWDGPRPDVITAVMAVGAELFEPRDGRWFRPNERLPVFDVPPPGDPVPLDRVVIPAAFTAIAPGDHELECVLPRLVRCDVPHPTTSIRCFVEMLKTWAETTTTAEILAVKSARNGDVAWLFGSTFPVLVGGQRFWGDRVLIPLGLRAEPDWPEPALREAANVGPYELLVLMGNETEAIPADAFRPLTRAAIRRLASGVT
jgi:MoxR-vWA-beta-propeller ternary system domain bpX2